ncbi:paraquat-inducible protein B [Thioclava dalianensis]|uniref:Paraquat-inducible protein B n=1 Tax=Thioclava dalianensis TaxID=1185766 RepID=A0A074U6P0_9RHOB|nr:MlaD family protein [Thioclava dalianensis]KEP70302.1 paraquat-inducible protein B [Thioclava dalianensis]SFN33919.1 paraquat-inducible protein B [Thioclava dalianensis]
MTETPDPGPAELKTSAAKRPIWSRLSIIWIVPLLALVVTLGVAWKSFADRGELIHIDFKDATGVEVGTPLKFRDVQVGKVESVGFTSDLTQVRLGVRVDNDVAPYVDNDAKFWLVRPEVSARGIENLGTVLSGTYLEGFWTNKPSGARTQFTGLERPPLSPDPSKGTIIELRAQDAGGIVDGAPILYHGITVGHLQNLRLNKDGSGVIVDAFIEAPHNKLLTTQTRFWNTSGFSVKFDTSGLSLDVRSLATLVQGGVEFDTFTSGGDVVKNQDTFRLYDSQDVAKNSVFESDQVDPPRYTLLFDDPVQGLEVGSKVQVRGVEAGEVTALAIKVSTDSTGQSYAQQQVTIALSPDRLGLARDSDEKQTTQFIESQVVNGLRARIASVGLLGGTKIIELTDVPDQPNEKMNLDAKPFPTIPTAPPTANDLSQSAKGVFNRIEGLPIEKLMNSAIRTLDSISAVAENENTRKVPEELSGLLNQLRSFATDLNDKGAADKTVAALDGVTDAASSVLEEIDGLHETLASADKAAQAIADMPLGDIGDKIDTILADINGLLNKPGTQDLPQSLNQTLEQTAAILEQLRKAGAADKLNQTLAATQDAAASVSKAADRLPELTQRLDTLVAQAQGLVSTYGQGSNFSNETLTTLRELRRSITDIGAVARMIERNPRAFILGR